MPSEVHFKVSSEQKVQILSASSKHSIPKFKQYFKNKKATKIIVIYDLAVQKHLLFLKNTLKTQSVSYIGLQVSENKKSFSSLITLHKKLAHLQVDRHTILIGMGGGVIGDIVGLLAQTYFRGLTWVSLPTTLLAQVDSGIGGKNGINTPAGKNAFGTVYQPELVFLNSEFLKTLPKREFVSSLGEMIKYSFLESQIHLKSKDITSLLKFSSNATSANLKNKTMLKKSLQFLSLWTLQCALLKMKYVEKDPYDLTSIRQKLNLGHTLAHALEKSTHYKKYQHGEAVLLGLQFALIVSLQKKLLLKSEFQKMWDVFEDLPLITLPKNCKGESLYAWAQKDKKAHSSTVQMVLLKKQGLCVNPVPVSKKEFLVAFQTLRDTLALRSRTRPHA